MSHPYDSLPEDRFWRTAVAGRDALEIAGLWKPRHQIGRRTGIVTAGSCFAQHFARALAARRYRWLDFEPGPAGLTPEQRKDYHYGTFSFRTGNIYTPRMLREWLTWPTNLFERLPTGALFFACRAAGWDRQQLVRAVLLAALNIPQARLILHGFPWSAFRGQTVGEHDFLLVSNGPEMAQAATVLVASHAHQHHELARRFLSGSVTLEENLALLQYGQGILCFEKEYFLTSWLNEPK